MFIDTRQQPLLELGVRVRARVRVRVRVIVLLWDRGIRRDMMFWVSEHPVCVR